MTVIDSRQSYLDHVAALKTRLQTDSALQAAIGGEFIAMGLLEHDLLAALGLQDGDRVIDVGCGSGRLAGQLARYPTLRYLGVDVVPDLLAHAARIAQRPDWEFQATPGTEIPAPPGEADFVCFFSVFTHLLHEQSYRYLREAKRVLKSGGRIVFSFLEFRIAAHWDQFQQSLTHVNAKQHLNQFIDRETILIWARKLGLSVELIADGDRPHIPLAQDIAFESGHAMRGFGNLGQSVAVLRVPGSQESTPAPAAGGAATTDSEALLQRLVSLPCEPAISGRIACVSARSSLGSDSELLVLGFVVTAAVKRVLIRAVGPGLSVSGVPQPLAHPQWQVLKPDGSTVLTGTDWNHLAHSQKRELLATMQRVGAGPFQGEAGDGATIAALEPGSYSVVITRLPGETGVVLAEVFDLAG